MLPYLHSHPKLCAMSRHEAPGSLLSCLARSCVQRRFSSSVLTRVAEGVFQVIKQVTGAGRNLVKRHDTQLSSSLEKWIASSSHRKHKMEERNPCIR